ncbi:MAG TPA: ATPase, T2SS/T4P/T4SS family, partial [Actinomycetota bacterium]
MPIADYLRYMVEAGASDLHLKVGLPPVVRVDGDLMHSPFQPLTPTDTEALAAELLTTERKRDDFEQRNECDTGFTMQGVGRFRVNVYRQRGEVSVAIRRVRSEIPTFGELRLPPVIQELAREPRGLVLVTGPTGTGKTTTIASIIGWINANRRVHVVTIEDPIEVVHDDLQSVIQQREIGLDTETY